MATSCPQLTDGGCLSTVVEVVVEVVVVAWCTGSMTSAPATSPHPIVGFTAALSGALDRVLTHDPVFLTVEEKRQTLLDLARERARLEALELKVLAAADREEVGAESGATSTAAWLASQTLADRPEVAAKVRLARALEEQRPVTLA